MKNQVINIVYVDKTLNCNLSYYRTWNCSSETALHIACKNGHLVVAKALIDSEPANVGVVNYQDRKGNTPLHHCVLNGNYELVKLLLSYGAAIDIKNIAGKTPIEEAIERNHLAVLSLLQKRTTKI